MRKVTSSEMLKNNEKKICIMYKKKYILKLRLNVVTAGTEALVVSGNKYLYAYLKEVCRHWAQPRFDTYHQDLIIVVEPILRKTCDSLAFLW
jgi:hypothetical protein